MELEVNGQPLRGGDALMMEGENSVNLAQGQGAEVLVFDLQA
jgi:redox-sensitive bicupin YhaK (pirin superfamily)